MHALTGTRPRTGGRATRPASVVFGLVVAWLVAGHGLAGTVAADEPTRGQVLVPADHVDPGAAFKVSGYDLDEGAPVRIEIVRGDVRVQLGSASTASDGTLDISLVMPASFPTGYADLHVVTIGAMWSTTVLVGDRAEGPSGTGAIGAAEDRWAILVVLAGTAFFALVVLMIVRGRVRGVPPNDAGGDRE